MLKEKIRSQILNGSLADNKHHLAGIYKGFHITLTMAGTEYIVVIGASSSGDENNNQLKSFLVQQKNAVKKLVNAEVYPYCVILTIQAPNLAKNVADTINQVVDPIINFLIAGQYHSGCEQCGSASEIVECYEVNGVYYYLCKSCAAALESRLQAEKQTVLSKKSNLPAGLVGAFLGALIGGIVWILIYKLGYIAGIAGAITGICAMKGYELFGGILDKKGVVGSVIIMIITIFFANQIAWAWEAYDALKDYGATFFDIFRNLNDIIKESDLMAAYIKDLVIGYILTIAASFKSICGAFMTSMGSYKMKKN